MNWIILVSLLTTVIAAVFGTDADKRAKTKRKEYAAVRELPNAKAATEEAKDKPIIKATSHKRPSRLSRRRGSGTIRPVQGCMPRPAHYVYPPAAGEERRASDASRLSTGLSPMLGGLTFGATGSPPISPIGALPSPASTGGAESSAISHSSLWPAFSDGWQENSLFDDLDRFIHFEIDEEGFVIPPPNNDGTVKPENLVRQTLPRPLPPPLPLPASSAEDAPRKRRKSAAAGAVAVPPAAPPASAGTSPTTHKRNASTRRSSGASVRRANGASSRRGHHGDSQKTKG